MAEVVLDAAPEVPLDEAFDQPPRLLPVAQLRRHPAAHTTAISSAKKQGHMISSRQVKNPHIVIAGFARFRLFTLMNSNLLKKTKSEIFRNI